MPPKKKRCPPPPKKPGVGQQHLLDNFSQLPTDGDFLNGHILYVYSCRCGSSLTKTVQEILPLLPKDSSTPDSCTSASLFAAVKRIVSRTLKKFHNLTNETEFRNFADICKQEFSSKRRKVKPHLGLSLDGGCDKLPETPVKNLASKSPLMTRQLAKCKNCIRLNKSMTDMKRRHLELQRDRIIAIRNLKMKQKNKGAMKTLKQKSIRRKNEQIERHKTKNAGDKRRFASLEKKHRELKRYYKTTKKSLVFQKKKETDERIVDLERKLGEKENEVLQLQTEKLVLEEKVQEIESMSKPSKSGEKSYISDTRMMVYDAIVNRVPMNNIPNLIEKFSSRIGVTLPDIPHSSTVENMVRELGAIAELQTVEVVIDNADCTIGFDATTQEGTHINSVHVTTTKDCYYEPP